MALAILELLAFEKGNVRFSIDTGTNRYYRLKIGRKVERRHGIDWVDEVIFSSPMEMNDAGGRLLHSAQDVSVPAARLESGNVYAQLFSFKTKEGKSPAFSSAIRVPMGSGVPIGNSVDYSPPFSLPASLNMKTNDTFQPPRFIPCGSYAERYSQPASLEDLLGGIVKIAAPAVVNLLGGTRSGAPQNAASGPAASTGNAGQANLLTLLLNTILGSLTGNASQQLSLIGPAVYHNRFLDENNATFSRPFIFGIDDALLGTLIGPVIQVLPQLLNAANQQRLQMRQENNKLTAGIVSDVNRRMLLNQLLQAQRETPPGGQPGSAVDLNQLIQLLQQVPATPSPTTAGSSPQPSATAAATPTETPTTTTSGTRSLSLDTRQSFTLSTRAVVSFVTANPVPWNGMQKVLFAKNQGLQLKIRLDVAEPAPKTPLPKAILKVVFKDGSDQLVRYEKTFKQKDVLPNSVMTFPFTQGEVSHLPVNRVTAVFAEMRWLNSKTGKESKALGSTEIVLVNKYFLKEQGKAVSTELELMDMKRFRPFWNKVWEVAPLDAASRGRDSEKKYLWELDVNTKYSVLLSPHHEANGLMETKILQGRVDKESLVQRTEGLMKAGIELSLAELNKLAPLWDGETALDPDRLEAFNTDAFAKNNASEFISNFRLKGKARERGMIWVVPTFRLFEFALNAASKTDEAGQVALVTEEKIRFPLPVSARVIGLKSQP